MQLSLFNRKQVSFIACSIVTICVTLYIYKYVFVVCCFYRMEGYGSVSDGMLVASTPSPSSSVTTSGSGNNNWTSWELGGNWSLNSNDADTINDFLNNGSSINGDEFEEDDPFTTVSLTCIGKDENGTFLYYLTY